MYLLLLALSISMDIILFIRPSAVLVPESIMTFQCPTAVSIMRETITSIQGVIQYLTVQWLVYILYTIFKSNFQIKGNYSAMLYNNRANIYSILKFESLYRIFSLWNYYNFQTLMRFLCAALFALASFSVRCIDSCKTRPKQDLIQSGHVSLENNGEIALTQKQYPINIQYQVPSLGFEIAVVLQNMNGYAPKTLSDYEVIASRKGNENAIVITYKNKDNSWRKVDVSYMVSSFADIKLGHFIADSITKYEKTVSDNGYEVAKIEQVVKNNIDKENTYGVQAFLSGVKSALVKPSFKIKEPSFDSKAQRITVNLVSGSLKQIQVLKISYIIWKEANKFSLFDFFPYQDEFNSDYRLFGFIGLDGDEGYLKGTAVNSNRITCSGKGCENKCTSVSDCKGKIVNSECVQCGTAQNQQEDGTCTEIKCHENEQLKGNTCQCKEGFNKVKGTCAICDSNSYYDIGREDCVCNFGFYKSQSKCLACDVSCGACRGPGNDKCVTCASKSYQLKDKKCLLKEPIKEDSATQKVPITQASKVTETGNQTKKVEENLSKPAEVVVETKPAETKPVETKPAEVVFETKPVETKPAETKPAEVVVETKPAETKPAEAVVETKPVETKPAEVVVETKPAETKPVETKPAETKPAEVVVETKPAETKPAEVASQTKTAFIPPLPAILPSSQRFSIPNYSEFPTNSNTQRLQQTPHSKPSDEHVVALPSSYYTQLPVIIPSSSENSSNENNDQSGNQQNTRYYQPISIHSGNALNQQGTILKGYTFSNLPYQISSNQQICQRLLKITITHSQVVPGIKFQYLGHGHRPKMLISFDFGSVISPPPFSYELRLNPDLNNHFSQGQMDILIKQTIDPATLVRRNVDRNLRMNYWDIMEFNVQLTEEEEDFVFS